jgi:hypothetical protein
MKFAHLAVGLLVCPALLLAKTPAADAPAPPPAAAVAVARGPADPSLPRPRLAPPAGWVDVLPLPKPPSDADGAATVELLGDVQVHFAPQSDQSYYASAWQIGTAQGLDGSALNLEWDPSLEVLTIHKYRILRDGQGIDLLGDGSKIKVIQRESGMESLMLDGRLTATLQPEDLRVGDVIELAYTIERRDPATGGFSEDVLGPSDGSAFGRFRMRVLWGKDKKIQYRVYPGILQPKLTKTASGSELVADVFDKVAPTGPESAPARFGLVNAVEVTQFADWQGVSRTMDPLYAKAVKLAPDSKIRVEAARIAAQSQDPKRRAELALSLVQEQVRYLFLGMDAGGYVPAAADQTWARRFGDCKGKTVLLLALLGELGIEARPVLVNTKRGDLVGHRLPAMGAFDHVIVEARIGGKSYWLDGTRLGDERLDLLETPDYRWGLPVTAAGSGLVQILPDPLAKPSQVISLTLDASKGLDLPAVASGEMRFHGVAASNMRLTYSGFSQADRQRALRKLWRETYDFVAPGKIVTRSDPETGEFIVTMTGSATMEWTRDLGTRWYEMDRSRLGWRFDIAREGELNADAPYAFDYPDWWIYKQTIVLPHEGKGFRLQGEGFDQTIGDLYQFKRTVAKDGASVTMTAETRALAGELPAARASRTRAAMAELAGNSVFVRMPADYEPTEAEKEQTRREDAAEAGAAKAKGKAKDKDKAGGK